MKNKLIAVVAAAVLAVLGVVLLVSYVNDADERALEGAELTEVLQVTAEVATRTPAADLGDKVQLVKIPKAAVVTGSLTSLDEVAGQVTRSVLVPGDQLTAGKFSSLEKVTGDVPVPKGMQELSVPLDGARIVGGALSAGDKVGVMASYDNETANPINELLILRIAGAAVNPDGEGGATILTFAVDTLDAEKIVHAMEFGKVWLTKQNDDTDTGGGKTISKEDVAP